MSRPRDTNNERAKADFKKELEKRMIDFGIRSKGELADRMNKDPRTLYHRFEDVGKLRICEVKSLVGVLCPDPILLLRLAGYSDKEIKRALERC